MSEVAQLPSSPPGNPEMPDAAPPPQNPATVRRLDYTAPPWLVPEIALDFALGLETTRVRSTMIVERNPAGDGRAQFKLDGDGIAVEQLTLDGRQFNSWAMDGDNLLIDLPGDRHEIVIETRIHPAANTQLSGLYASNGMLCTQCEAEGFRRITFFPDRPDVLSRYTVRMSGRQGRVPGAALERQPGRDRGRATAMARTGPNGTIPGPSRATCSRWSRANWSPTRDSFTTRSGRKVDLAIYVRPGDETRTDHAMRSLIASMKWDEDVYGREYDLDVFNIVAVSRFQRGRDGEQGPQRLQHPLHPRRSGNRDRRRLRRDRGRRRARVFPQLVGQPRHLPRLVPAEPQGRLHRAARPAVQRRHGLGPGQADRGRARSCAPASSPRIRARWRTRSGPIPIRKSATSTPRRSTTRAPK